MRKKNWTKTSKFVNDINLLIEKKHEELSNEAMKLSLEDIIEQDKSIAENFVCSICMDLVDISSAV